MQTSKPTRMIAMGSRALMQGFGLVGFETMTDCTTKGISEMLEDLIARKERAFIIIEKGLASEDMSQLDAIRSEGGRIVVMEVPPLNRPDEFHSPVAGKVRAMFGENATGDL